MGWASKRNGELLALAVGQFDVFLTADRNLSYQQDLSSLDIAVVVLVARSNRLDDLRPDGLRYVTPASSSSGYDLSITSNANSAGR